jgi:hypothetical protein
MTRRCTVIEDQLYLELELDQPAIANAEHWTKHSPDCAENVVLQYLSPMVCVEVREHIHRDHYRPICHNIDLGQGNSSLSIVLGGISPGPVTLRAFLVVSNPTGNVPGTRHSCKPVGFQANQAGRAHEVPVLIASSNMNRQVNALGLKRPTKNNDQIEPSKHHAWDDVLSAHEKLSIGRSSCAPVWWQHMPELARYCPPDFLQALKVRS